MDEIKINGDLKYNAQVLINQYQYLIRIKKKKIQSIAKALLKGCNKCFEMLGLYITVFNNEKNIIICVIDENNFNKENEKPDTDRVSNHIYNYYILDNKINHKNNAQIESITENENLKEIYLKSQTIYDYINNNSSDLMNAVHVLINWVNLYPPFFTTRPDIPNKGITFVEYEMSYTELRF